MKSNVFFKAVCIAIFMVVISTMVKAQSGLYYTNDVMDGDQVATRFVYKMDGGLQYHLKYDFPYDQENRLTTKDAFQWDCKTLKWMTQTRIYYSYIGPEIFIAGNSWNKKEQTYTQKTHHSIYSMNRDDLSTHIAIGK